MNFDPPLRGMLAVSRTSSPEVRSAAGVVVSGEYISHLNWNAAQQIRSLFSKSHHLRSVTRVRR